jgi:prepilin-type N-terminal cleavage/methylation domain-containing protein
MKIRTNKGFSLLEVLLVITLLSILFIILVNNIQPVNILIRSEDRRKEADALTIYQALEQYAIKNNAYPDSIKNMPNDSSFDICKTTAPNCPSPKINLSSILVPTYFAKIPEYSTDSINSGFYIVKDINGKIGVGGTRKLNNTAFVKGLEKQSFENIVTDGLVLHLDSGNSVSYPGSGTTWLDLSGNGNNGTLLNGVGYNSANGGSLSFDGVNDYVDAGLSPSVRTSNLTYEVWIKFSVSQSSRTIMGIYADGIGGALIGIHDNFPNRIKFHTNSIGSGNGVIGTNQLNNNIWTHVVGTYDSSGLRTMKLYVNSLLNTTLNGPTTPNYPSDRNLNIGRWTGGGTQYFNGNIASTKIYNRALTQDEIQQNFNATKGRFGL